VANAIALAIDHQRAEDALVQREADLARLTERIENIREEERAQVAREIHDELGAVLSLLKIQVASVQKRTRHDPEVLEKTQSILDQLDHAIRTIQRIAKDLRPSLLDHFGLGAAMEEYVDTNCHRDVYVCEKDIDMDVVIDSLRATALFRVFQEAITNIIRHAKAKNILVRLKQDGTRITLVVNDNGVGIERGQLLRRDSLGLIGMRERIRPFGGIVTIVGRPSQGTTVTVAVPNTGGSFDNRKPGLN
jgi:two-component system sensor histidine kinase UhpB